MSDDPKPVVYDFSGPQPFNVDIGPEPQVTPHMAMPVLGPSVPPVEQVITPDRELYPARDRRGLRNGVVR